MSLPVRTTPEADVQIRSIDDWWRANRAASPNLFADELTSSFDIIGLTPNIGRLYRRSPVKGTRRKGGVLDWLGLPPRIVVDRASNGEPHIDKVRECGFVWPQL